MKNQENLEGIISRLKEQGIKAGEKEKQQLIDAANEQAEKIMAEATAKSHEIVEKARNEAAQMEKNARAAIAQAARDLVEATKIAVTRHLQDVFGDQCKSLMNQEEYLKELLKVVLELLPGDKTVSVSPELAEKMQSFIAGSALKAGIEVKPLERSEAKIVVSCTDNEGIQFVVTAADIENGLFSLLNKELVERITNSRES